jgi:hypothetical protein
MYDVNMMLHSCHPETSRLISRDLKKETGIYIYIYNICTNDSESQNLIGVAHANMKGGTEVELAIHTEGYCERHGKTPQIFYDV